jgi:hypothetical protein
MCASERGIAGDRGLEVVDRLVYASPPVEVHPAQVQLVRLEVCRAGVPDVDRGPVAANKCHTQRAHDRVGDFVLHGEDARHRALVGLTPQYFSIRRTGELR